MPQKYTINIPSDVYMLRVPELKKMLRKSERCIRNMLNTGVLPGIRINRQWYVPKDALSQWLSTLLIDREKALSGAETGPGKAVAKSGKMREGGGMQSQPSTHTTVIGNLNAHEPTK